ncbi:hypothetical protein HPB47_007353 [Ixodes persulcatus]|uniref:Uncharacterized protein n=1 Tax=Ixodes persulcatus TaxID=34615 RepID=A0AC60P8I3_IXOPE|nr:hypothetical protein HPB47_007353 [Ixodes persulcatus]
MKFLALVLLTVMTALLDSTMGQVDRAPRVRSPPQAPHFDRIFRRVEVQDHDHVTGGRKTMRNTPPALARSTGAERGPK